MAGDARSAEVLALVKAQARSRQQILSILQGTVRSETEKFTDWYDPAKVTAWATLLAKLTRTAQKQTALSTDSFAVRVMWLLTGRRFDSPGVTDVSKLRGGVPLDSVYGRAADQFRYLTATRSPEARVADQPDDPRLLEPAQVQRRVVLRVLTQAEDNLALAMQGQWADEIDAAGSDVAGFRRVIHPEMSAGGSCGLCVVASDRRYSRGDLLPLHAACKCDVLPIVEDGDGGTRFDPGAALNAADLRALYKAAGSTAAEDLKRTRVTVENHSELGPRLVVAGQRFRGARDAAAASAA